MNGWQRTMLYQMLWAVKQGKIDEFEPDLRFLLGLETVGLVEQVGWDSEGNLEATVTPLGNRLLTLLERES